jgi:hypothetical protein
VVALGQAERLHQELEAWRKSAEQRARGADLTAEVFEAHGRPAPAISDADSPPPWLAARTERERANLAVWERRGAEAADAWAALMRKPSAD